MENDNSLIKHYLSDDYEKNYRINMSKYELLSIIYDKLSIINSNLEKFIKEKIENKISKDKEKDKILSYKNENKFYNLYFLIEKTIQTSFNENNKMINKILEYITQLKECLNNYNKKYHDYINYQHSFSNKLIEIEGYKKKFLESAKNAENFTYSFYKRKVNNKKVNNDEFAKKEELRNIAKIDCEKYKNIINVANQDLKNFNKKQEKLFEIEKRFDIKYNELYYDSLNNYYECQSFINQNAEYIKQEIIEHFEKKIIELKDLLMNYKQKEEIEFVQYKTEINFDECDDGLELNICAMAYNEIAENIGKYKDIELDKETKKLQINTEIKRILNLDGKIRENDVQKLEEYLKKDSGQQIFISYLNILRTNGRYQKSKKYIDIMGKLLNIILMYAEKEKNYENAKNCIILSQTFYYNDEIKNQKVYIFKYIKDNKWIKGSDFWRNFIEVNINNQLESKIGYDEGKLSDLIFTQLVTFITNMKQLNIDLRIITKIADEFIEKYNYLKKESRDILFNIISNDKDEIEKLRKEYKEDPDLEKKLYNNSDENKNLKEREDNKNKDEVKQDNFNEK